MVKEQLQMFESDEVLPLWTGTAVTGRVEVYRPRPAARQAAFGCPVCHDTGVVRVNGRLIRCTCSAGAGKEVDDD